MPDDDPAVEVMWRDLHQVLDEELSRLAEKYRAPLVLFYLAVIVAGLVSVLAARGQREGVP